MTETEQAQALLNYLSSNVLRRPGIQLIHLLWWMYSPSWKK